MELNVKTPPKFEETVKKVKRILDRKSDTINTEIEVQSNE